MCNCRGFNARSFSSLGNDINTAGGSKLLSFTASSAFFQLRNKLTHVKANSSLCIDLSFADQPNLLVNTGIHASLHENCLHQMVHFSFNLIN